MSGPLMQGKFWGVRPHAPYIHLPTAESDLRFCSELSGPPANELSGKFGKEQNEREKEEENRSETVERDQT